MLHVSKGAICRLAISGNARLLALPVRASRMTLVCKTRSPIYFRQGRPAYIFRMRAEKDDANPDLETKVDEDLPPWVKREREKKIAEQTGELPFGLYLLLSSMVAIAAIGSIFELANKNPLFGILPPENPLWAPILIAFAITGLPSAGYLFVKAISAANKAADAMDRVDGY